MSNLKQCPLRGFSFGPLAPPPPSTPPHSSAPPCSPPPLSSAVTRAAATGTHLHCTSHCPSRSCQSPEVHLSAPPLPHLPPQVQDSCGHHPSCFTPYSCHPHSYQGEDAFSLSDSPRRLHENVGALHELVLTVHSGLRVKVRNPHPLISFPPLRLNEDFI